jgi:membrane protein implicated in regulation of membrane protease activity
MMLVFQTDWRLEGDSVLAVYVGLLLFGGLLIAASLFGAGHDADVHVDVHGGDTGHGDGHDQSQASALLSLFGLRFWSFGTAFFGLTGVILHLVGGPALAAAAPFIAGGVGVAAGLGASSTFRALSRETVGQLRGAGALVGREGRLLLPVARGQRGKVRIAVPGSGDVDLIAEADDDGALDAGTVVLIVEVRGNVAIVERGPATSPAGRS